MTQNNTSHYEQPENELYQTEDELNQTVNGKVKFPMAAVFFSLYIVWDLYVMLLSSYGLTDILLSYINPNYELLVKISTIFRILYLLAYIFLVIVLLLKKRGALLIVAVGAIAILPVITGIATDLVLFQYGLDESYNPLTIFEQLSYPELLLLCLLIYCDRRKSSLKPGIVQKLLYIPGGLKAFFFMFLLVAYYPDYYAPNILVFSLLDAAAFLFLGYWIYYIYSVRSCPTHCPECGDVLED